MHELQFRNGRFIFFATIFRANGGNRMGSHRPDSAQPTNFEFSIRLTFKKAPFSSPCDWIVPSLRARSASTSAAKSSDPFTASVTNLPHTGPMRLGLHRFPLNGDDDFITDWRCIRVEEPEVI